MQAMKKNKSGIGDIFKSTGAVLAGFIAVLVLSILTDILLVKLGIFPPQSETYFWWMLLIALIYRCLFAAVGGFITASLAPDRAMVHVIVLGVIGLVFALVGSIANWGKTAPSTAWYPVLLIILTLPSVLVGGKLRNK